MKCEILWFTAERKTVLIFCHALIGQMGGVFEILRCSTILLTSHNDNTNFD